MTWSPKTEGALKTWLTPETAHGHSPDDDARFYDFILNVWIDIQKIWDEGSARDIMKKRAQQLHHEWSPEMIAIVRRK